MWADQDEKDEDNTSSEGEKFGIPKEYLQEDLRARIEMARLAREKAREPGSQPSIKFSSNRKKGTTVVKITMPTEPVRKGTQKPPAEVPADKWVINSPPKARSPERRISRAEARRILGLPDEETKGRVPVHQRLGPRATERQEKPYHRRASESRASWEDENRYAYDHYLEGRGIYWEADCEPWYSRVPPPSQYEEPNWFRTGFRGYHQGHYYSGYEEETIPRPGEGTDKTRKRGEQRQR